MLDDTFLLTYSDPFVHPCVGASVNARDHKRQAPLHIAAEEYEEDLLLLLLDNNADTGLTDVDGNTPLDVAAKERWEDGFDILLSHTVSSRRDDQAKKSLKKAMEGQRTRDDFVAEQLEEMSPFKCVGPTAMSMGPGT